MASVTVKINADITQLEKDLAIAEKELSNQVQLYGDISKQIDNYSNKLKQLPEDIKEANQELQKLQEKQFNLTSNGITTENLAQRKAGKLAIAEQVAKIQDMKNAQVQYNAEVSKLQTQYQKVGMQVDKTRNKVDKINMKRVQLDTKKAEASMKSMKGAVGGVASGTEKAIRSVGKWALAIFGIRSAYSLLKQASSNLASYDEQYATNLEYIKFVLTQAIAPVLRYIVNLAMTLLNYINAIVNAWFGINLFANASASDFKKMQQATDKSNKSAKELKRTLAGFDEMNVISDNNSSGSGAVAPSMDLSKMQGEPPTWLKWIIDHKDEILGILAGALAGVLALKMGLGGIKALGIGMMVSGLIIALSGVIKYLKDPSWKNFGQTLVGIGIAVAGLGLVIGSLPVAVVGACIAIVGLVAMHWEQIKSTLQGGIDWLQDQSDTIHFWFGDFIGGLYDVWTTGLQFMLDELDNKMKGLKGIFDGIINFIVGIFTGDWNRAWQGLVTIVGSVLSRMISKVRNVLNAIIRIFSIFGEFAGDSFGGALKSGINKAIEGVQTALNKIINAINRVIDKINALPNVNISRIPNINAYTPEVVKAYAPTSKSLSLYDSSGAFNGRWFKIGHRSYN